MIKNFPKWIVYEKFPTIDNTLRLHRRIGKIYCPMSRICPILIVKIFLINLKRWLGLAIRRDALRAFSAPSTCPQHRLPPSCCFRFSRDALPPQDGGRIARNYRFAGNHSLPTQLLSWSRGSPSLAMQSAIYVGNSIGNRPSITEGGWAHLYFANMVDRLRLLVIS